MFTGLECSESNKALAFMESSDLDVSMGKERSGQIKRSGASIREHVRLGKSLYSTKYLFVRFSSHEPFAPFPHLWLPISHSTLVCCQLSSTGSEFVANHCIYQRLQALLAMKSGLSFWVRRVLPFGLRV